VPVHAPHQLGLGHRHHVLAVLAGLAKPAHHVRILVLGQLEIGGVAHHLGQAAAGALQVALVGGVDALRVLQQGGHISDPRSRRRPGQPHLQRPRQLAHQLGLQLEHLLAIADHPIRHHHPGRRHLDHPHVDAHLRIEGGQGAGDGVAGADAATQLLGGGRVEELRSLQLQLVDQLLQLVPLDHLQALDLGQIGDQHVRQPLLQNVVLA
jgi:hypothetical protein